MGKRSFAARRVLNVIVYVHTADAPTDEEWEVVLDYYRKASDLLEFRTLVYSAGGAPNAGQRARLAKLLGEKRAPIAVLTPSALVRAAGTALSWFRPDIRVFGAEDVNSAIEHLGLSVDAAARTRNVLAELKIELGLA